MSKKLNVISLASVVLGIISLFLAWQTIELLGQTISANGFKCGNQGMPGKIYLVEAILVGVMAFINQKWSNIIGIVIAVLTILFPCVLIITDSEHGMVKPGIGVYLATVAMVGAIVGFIMSMRQPKA